MKFLSLTTGPKLNYSINQAMNIGIQPQNIVSTSKKLYEIADIIVTQNIDNNLERESSLLRLNIMKIFILSGIYMFIIKNFIYS
jgi:hypothetical protein